MFRTSKFQRFDEIFSSDINSLIREILATNWTLPLLNLIETKLAMQVITAVNSNRIFNYIWMTQIRVNRENDFEFYFINNFLNINLGKLSKAIFLFEFPVTYTAHLEIPFSNFSYCLVFWLRFYKFSQLFELLHSIQIKQRFIWFNRMSFPSKNCWLP